MKCESCNAEVDILAKFCPSCGTKIIALSEGKSPQEVTLEWLGEVFKRQKYDVTNQESDAKTLICKSIDDGPNYIINIKHDLRIITIQSVWIMKNTTGWGKKTDLLTTLNKANANSWIGIFCIADDDSLIISTHINLTEQITERDIISFLDVFDASQSETIRTSGLIDFS